MLKIGVLGTARITPAALIKPARRTGRAEVVAVASRDPARARKYAKKHKIPGVADSYEALLSDPEIQAIYNPLPNGWHGHWTIAALDAGKHVLCEKPFTANADEARQVAEAGAAHPGQVVMEAFHYEYHPMTRRLVEIVQSGALGTIREIDISFSAPNFRRDDIRYQLGLAGGAMMDMGCYPISLLRLLAAGPRVTEASAKLSSPGVDRAMDARFSLPEGGTARVRCSLLSSSLFRTARRGGGHRGDAQRPEPLLPPVRAPGAHRDGLGDAAGEVLPAGHLRLPARGVRRRRRGRRAVPHHRHRRHPHHGADRRHLRGRRSPHPPTLDAMTLDRTR